MLKQSPHVDIDALNNLGRGNEKMSQPLSLTLAQAGLAGRAGEFCNRLYLSCTHNRPSLLTPEHLSLFVNRT